MKFSLATLFAAILAGDVHVLNNENFSDFIKDNAVSLVKFMAPWCGHCKTLAPEFEKAATLLKEKIPLAEVDATENRDLAVEYGVQGFPTMFLFRNGTPEPYEGGRTVDTIVQWVEDMTGPAVNWVTGAEEISADKYFLALTEAKDLLESAADATRSMGKFYGIESSDELVRIVHPGEEPIEIAMPDNTDAIVEFVKANRTPLFGAVSGANYADYAEKSSEWVWLASDAETYEAAGDAMRTAAKANPEMNFVWLDTASFEQHAKHMLGLESFPAIASLIGESKYHFTKPVEGVTANDVAAFVKDVKNGDVERFLKSEPIPEENNGPVLTVVGKNFGESVLRKDKDVFVKIYAPWCGHCKKMAPVWEELAEKLVGTDVVVADFDGTANEPDVTGFEYRSFPTLYYVKAGTTEPIPYNGDRTLESFIDFVEETTGKKLVEEEKVEDEVKTEDIESKSEL